MAHRFVQAFPDEYTKYEKSTLWMSIRVTLRISLKLLPFFDAFPPLNQRAGRLRPAQPAHWIRLFCLDGDRLGLDLFSLRKGDGENTILELSLGLFSDHTGRQGDRTLE